MKCFTPIPDLALAVRTDASIGHLQAFLGHHLRICEKAYVLVDCRPGEDGGQVFALLEGFITGESHRLGRVKGLTISGQGGLAT